MSNVHTEGAAVVQTRFTRRKALGLFGAAGALAVTSGCGSSVGGGSGGGGGGGSGAGAIKVGLVIPQAGVYAPIGVDMQRGWDLWLQQNGGMFGNRKVTTVTADEGEGPQTGVPAVQRLLQAEQCDVLVGIVNSAVALGSVDLVAEAKKLLIVSNAGAGAITGEARSPYVWRTSFTNAQVAAAMGRNLAEAGVRPVYALAPDYAAGTEVLEGFRKAYEGAGGQVSGTASPPFGTTQDYQPFLAGIEPTGAAGTFCFFAGGEAVSFVQQYAGFGLKGRIPLFGSGFLTEGGVLEAQGQAALGVQTTLHYSTEIENDANAAFVEAYTAANDASPTVYSVQTYDAAEVLSRAVQAAGAVDGDALGEAMGSIGAIDTSPRGSWTFDGQTPRQTMYLRTVEDRGGTLVNAVTTELGEFSQPT